LCCLVNLWWITYSIILSILYCRVGCARDITIIVILLRYVSLLYRWWVYQRLLHDRHLVRLWVVSPCALWLGMSRYVVLWVILPILTHPLWPSRLLRGSPSLLGTLQVFWTRFKKLVQRFDNLTRRLFKVYVFPTCCVVFPG
jgi:hypothetical protein